MRIILQTIYEPVNEEFIEWYLLNLESNGRMNVAKDLKANGRAEMKSKDPTSGTWGETVWRIEKD